MLPRDSAEENAGLGTQAAGPVASGAVAAHPPDETPPPTAASMYAEIRRVFRHALVYGLASAAAGLVGFIMIPVYTRYLTPSDYGIVELLQLTSNIISIVLSLGFSTTVLRFYFLYDTREDQRQVVSTALIMVAVVGTGATLLLLTQAAGLSRLVLGKPGYAGWVAIMLFTNLFTVILVVPLAYVQALRRPVLYGGIALGRLVLGLSLNILFVVVLKQGVLGVLLSALIVAGASSLGLSAAAVRRVGLALSRPKLSAMLAYGGPLVPATLFMFVLHFGDRFFLQRLASLEQVGLYALGYKFGMMLAVLVMEPFGLIWGATMFAVVKREDARQIYARVFTYFLFVATFFALAVSVLIKDVLRVVTTPRFYPAHTVVPIILGGLLCLAASHFFETGIHLVRRTVFRAIGVGFAAALNVVLNLLLVPRYGMMGAAWATLFSFASLAAAAYVFGQRLYAIPYEFGRALKLLAVAGAVFAASGWIHVASVAGSLLARGGLLLVYPALLYPLGFYRRDELHQALALCRRAAALLRRGRVLRGGADA